MGRRRMNWRRLVVSVLVLAVAFVSSATCLVAAAEMSHSDQHACCPAMMDDCAAGTTALEDCCAAQHPGQNGTVPAASFLLAMPAMIDTPVHHQYVLEPITTGEFAPDPSRAVSPPTYLLDSVVRI